MERLDVLVRQVRDQTGNQQYTSTQGIKQREFVRYANDAQMRIYNRILMERSSLYMKVGYLDVLANQAIYALATDIFLKHNVQKVDYSFNGDARGYYPLTMRTPRQEVSAPGYPDSYFLRHGEIVLSPIPTQGAVRGLRLNYQFTLPTLDIRRSAITGSGPAAPTAFTSASPTFSTNAISIRTYTGGLKLAVGVSGQISVSTNGITWSAPTSSFGATNIFDSAFNGTNTYIAIGDTGKIAYSTNAGVTWTQAVTGTAIRLTRAVYAFGLFIVTGDSGTLLTSPDGINWTPQTSTFGANAIFFVELVNGILFIGGGAGSLATSTNGTTWTAKTSTMGANPVRGVAYGGGIYIIVGDAAAACASSTDTTTWTAQTTGFVGGSVLGAAYGSGLFVIAGFNNQLFTSPDAVTWTARTSSFAPGVYLGATAFNVNYFILTHSNGGVAYSADGITWTTATATLSGVSFMSASSSIVLICSSSGQIVYYIPSQQEIVLTNPTEETELDLSTGWVDYVSIVDTNGVQLSAGLGVVSYNSTTNRLIVTSTAATSSTGYLVFGTNATTHSQLPDVAQRYLTEYMALRIQMRDSNSESLETSSVLRLLEDEIIDSIANLEEDLVSIAILDSSMLNYDEDL